jgi:ATP-dependent phosphoenolpyruvate carboxykinase
MTDLPALREAVAWAESTRPMEPEHLRTLVAAVKEYQRERDIYYMDGVVKTAEQLAQAEAQLSSTRADLHLSLKTNTALLDELEALRADIANWPVCDQHKPGMWDGEPPCVICDTHNTAKEGTYASL